MDFWISILFHETNQGQDAMDPADLPMKSFDLGTNSIGVIYPLGNYIRYPITNSLFEFDDIRNFRFGGSDGFVFLDGKPHRGGVGLHEIPKNFVARNVPTDLKFPGVTFFRD